MQTKNGKRVPVGIKDLANMMLMQDVEVRFFPKLDDLRGILKDYNFGKLTRTEVEQKLEKLKEECLEENFDTYAEGIGELIKAVRYKY